MPAHPLNPQQLAEAALLKSKFRVWQERRRAENAPYSQEWASDSLGFGQSALNQYLGGRIPLNPDAASKFARLMGCSVKDFSETIATQISGFAFGIAPPKISGNIEPGPEVRGLVPLLTASQAAMYKDFTDNFDPQHSDLEPVLTATPVNRHTFAMRVTGDSMAPRFPAGTLLIVEPDLAAEPGDFVIARLGSEEASFKELTKDGPDWYLKPLNDRYPIKPLGKATILGVVRSVELRIR